MSPSESGDPAYEEARQAADSILGRYAESPRVAIVLGSGLDAVAARIASPDRISYADIPHFPQPTVQGHSGELVLGRVGAVPVAVLRGRAHIYEGNTPQQAVLPLRAIRLLGAEVAVLTNAAGGLDPSFRAGDLMLLRDHIGLPTLVGNNPLLGPNDERFGPRFPAMTDAYDAELRAVALRVAEVRGVNLREGTYLMASGPSYETPAELRFMRMIGGDAVGMSTVPETIAARHMGMRVMAVSCITNSAAADVPEDIEQDHAMVLKTAQEASERLAEIIAGVLEQL
ncbi:MAG TPA: purine-nucleoside phosphorylase [Ktedonobacterales bacterium]|jgi:purine-nucleoside phosphorylase|nr:purine-nucleoside phosphorylase [Ktedonobacterales bacterium]